MPKRASKRKMQDSKLVTKSLNDDFFNKLTPKKQGNRVLLVVDGDVYFKAPSLSKVLKAYSKITNKEEKEISIIPLQKNKSIMVV